MYYFKAFLCSLPHQHTCTHVCVRVYLSVHVFQCSCGPWGPVGPPAQQSQWAPPIFLCFTTDAYNVLRTESSSELTYNLGQILKVLSKAEKQTFSSFPSFFFFFCQKCKGSKHKKREYEGERNSKGEKRVNHKTPLNTHTQIKTPSIPFTPQAHKCMCTCFMYHKVLLRLFSSYGLQNITWTKSSLGS